MIMGLFRKVRDKTSKILKRCAVRCYFALTLVWSGGIWVLLSPLGKKYLPIDAPPEAVWLGLPGPGLSAAAISYLDDGSQGLMDLVKPFAKWRCNPEYYFTVLAGPPFFYLSAIGASALQGEKIPSFLEIMDHQSTPLFKLPYHFLLLENTIVYGVCEELGWRGYGLKNLLKNYTPAVSSFILSIYWSVWHLPLLLHDDKSEVNFENILNYYAHILSLSIIYTWLYEKVEGSLLLTSLFHGALNTFSRFAPTIGSPLRQGPNITTTIMEAAIAAPCLRELNSDLHLSRHQRRTINDSKPGDHSYIHEGQGFHSSHPSVQKKRAQKKHKGRDGRQSREIISSTSPSHRKYFS